MRKYPLAFYFGKSIEKEPGDIVDDYILKKVKAEHERTRG